MPTSDETPAPSSGTPSPAPANAALPASQIATVAQLKVWLREHNPHWRYYGWDTDRDTWGGEGAVVFTAGPGGLVDIAMEGRGTYEFRSTHPSERDAVQVVLAHELLGLTRDHLQALDLDLTVTMRSLPSSALWTPDLPPPPNRWAVLADRATLIVGYMGADGFVERARTEDPEQAADIVVAALAEHDGIPTSAPRWPTSPDA